MMEFIKGEGEGRTGSSDPFSLDFLRLCCPHTGSSGHLLLLLLLQEPQSKGLISFEQKNKLP